MATRGTCTANAAHPAFGVTPRTPTLTYVPASRVVNFLPLCFYCCVWHGKITIGRWSWHAGATKRTTPTR